VQLQFYKNKHFSGKFVFLFVFKVHMDSCYKHRLNHHNKYIYEILSLVIHHNIVVTFLD